MAQEINTFNQFLMRNCQELISPLEYRVGSVTKKEIKSLLHFEVEPDASNDSYEDYFSFAELCISFYN